MVTNYKIKRTKELVNEITRINLIDIKLFDYL